MEPTLHELSSINKQMLASRSSLPVKPGMARQQFAPSQLFDNIAMLVRERLAAQSVCDEFIPQALDRSLDKPTGMGEQCPYDIVNKTALTGASHSPCSRVAPSPPKSTPATLSQVPVPHPQFNGHKPSIEGEERLNSNSSAINKANKTSVNIHLPDMPETVAEQSQACEYCEWLQGIVHSPRGPSLDREPDYGAQRESVEFSGAQTQHPSLNMDVVNKKNEKSTETRNGPHAICPGAAASPQAPFTSSRPSA
jgi:hypothetical protein